jgi:hypothetical protein
MIEPLIDLPSRQRRIIVEPMADGVRLTLRGKRLAVVVWDRLLHIALSVAALCAAVFIVLAVIHTSGFSSLKNFVWLLPLLATPFYAAGVMATMIKEMRSATIEVAAGQLSVAEGKARFSWPCEQIVALSAWQGLHIAESNGNSHILLAERNLDELAYAVRLIRDHWEVPEWLPPQPRELPVHYRGNYWDQAMTGMLSVEPGLIQLRHSFSSKPHLRFRKGGAYVNSFHDAIALSEDNVACRIAEDGSACLRITCDQVKCNLVDGRPELTVNLLGPLLQVRIRLESGTTGKRKLSAEEKDFWINISCDDGEALQRALGRFWGDREQIESSPR